MPIDVTMLEEHRRYEDHRTGISEEYLQPVVGGARTLAVLARPLGQSSDLGFIVCPSFGAEHTQLNGLEVVVARRMASAGFPVLRYQGQGYADSDGPRDTIGVASHLADAAYAVEVMSVVEGVRRVGLLGGLFGGTVAALVAGRLGLPAVALWEPVVDGGRYAERILRGVALQEVTGGSVSGGTPPLRALRERLMAGVSLDVRGFLLTKAAFEELHAVNLLTDLPAISGRVLLVGVSRSGRPGPEVAALAERLEGLGISLSLQGLQDKLMPPLGAFRYAPMAQRVGRVDMHFGLNHRIAEVTTGWAREVSA